MSFPPIARANVYNACLDQLWFKTGLDASTEYHRFLHQCIDANTNQNTEACKKYMESANAELLDTPLGDVLEGEDYHPALLKIFYTRICGRILAKINKRNRNPKDYFASHNNEEIAKERQRDVNEAISEEIKEITTNHATLTREETLQAAPSDLVNTYKYQNTWFKDVNNDLVLEVIEVIMDGVDKGNSLGNKITQQIAKAHPTPAPTDDSNSNNEPKHAVILNEFQIIGIVVSFAYLFLSVFTPLYKKFALKRDDPLINRWSLRYFIPSVVLFALGIIALTVPVAAVGIGICFALYSLASNIFKVSVYFSYYFDLKHKIKENRVSIEELATKRDELHSQIKDLKIKHKKLANTDEVECASECNNEIIALEAKHQETTMKWLSANAKKDELQVQSIRTLDKYTGFSNVVRLGLAIAGCIALILTLIPPTAPIGAIIAFTVLCIGTVILASHHINKFRLIREEKALARTRRDEFEPDYKQLSSQASMMKKLTDHPQPQQSEVEQQPLLSTAAKETPVAKPKMKYSSSVIDLLFASPPAHYHPDPDQDERPNPPTIAG